MSKVIDNASPSDGVLLIRADKVDSVASEWHMKGWLPEGELVILGGDGGAGKTLIAMDWIATLSNAGTKRGIFPDGSQARRGSSLIWSCEDDWQRTLKPRLDAAEANYRRIFFVGDVIELSSRRSFDFKRDLPGLVEQIEMIGDVKMLVIDTVMEVVSGAGTNAKAVRQDLIKLVEIAHKYRITIIGIAHLVKEAKKGDLVKSLAGSQAFSNLARHVLIAMRVNVAEQDEDSPSVGVLIRAKTNIGKSGGGRRYEIHPARVESVDGRQIDTTKLIWHKKLLPGSPADIRRWAECDKTEMADGPKNRAQQFLKQILADGPLPARELQELAEEDGISTKMLRNARERLGVISTRVNDREGGVWNEWSLPGWASYGDRSSMHGVDDGHARQSRQVGQVGQVGQVDGQPQEFDFGDNEARARVFEQALTHLESKQL
jgi:putative DNA primase/helicase